MLHIIDDFIKPRIQDEMEKILLGNNFPYFYANESVQLDNTNTVMPDDNALDVPQFFHMFVTDGKISSQHHNIVSPLAHKLIDIIDTDCYLYRCKVNLNNIDTRFEGKYHTPHIDNEFENQITAIYYVNDSDGDTLFFDDKGKITKKITPKKGRLVWWKGKIFHAKSSPIKTQQRLVVNFNLLPFAKES
jgi:hypothetical protein